jgi:hypothetical protein
VYLPISTTPKRSMVSDRSVDRHHETKTRRKGTDIWDFRSKGAVYAGYSPVGITKVCAVGLNLCRYWHQRYRLFSRYDDGIWMDGEAWYSVTPEGIARHVARFMAEKSPKQTIIDAFCGVLLSHMTDVGRRQQYPVCKIL